MRVNNNIIGYPAKYRMGLSRPDRNCYYVTDGKKKIRKGGGGGFWVSYYNRLSEAATERTTTIDANTDDGGLRAVASCRVHRAVGENGSGVGWVGGGGALVRRSIKRRRRC